MGFVKASAIAIGLLLFPGVTSSPTPPVDKRSDCSPNPRSIFIREILAKSNYPSHPTIPTPPDVPLKVGIIGAGAAGLYSAVLLDSLGIDYDILEASGRVGGRIYTYRFNDTAWKASTPDDPDFYDYYDVGAMRFPGMKSYMDRIIGTTNDSLIPYINSLVEHPKDKVQQIPYIFTAQNTFRRYNDILQYNQVPPTADIFDAELADNGTVDAQFARLDPTTVWANVTNTLTAALSNDFTEGFNLLMNYDQQSVRAYLLSQGFTSPQVDWLETINDATDHYDMYSMSQSVLEEWIFSEAPLDSWTCINGGMDRLTNGMLQIIKNKPIMNTPVTSILPATNQQLQLTFNGTQEKTYAHVISTIPLGALQTVDLRKLDIDYAQRHAIRKLNYDPAMKIGMKFKTRWWENLPVPFEGGQSYSDVPIRRCVYPSYGVNLPKDTAPGTMIASYVWGQDSSRLGAHLETPESRERLVEITLQDLAAMNNLTYEFIREQYVDYHAWDWYQDEWSVGAFAIFSPDQFSKVMPALMTPAENGHVHWGGEALSSGHAWIIGAVNSAYRCVVEILKTEGRDDLIAELVSKWGTIDEVEMGWYTTSDVGGP
ncbi:L-amino acid oxidase [Leptodontidium sp. MPI-SDFR-AT-0119]|nr:L-amino acid oxidase [Leptodontidium sp. MPI-SDFR-AT-0119]